MSRGNGIGPRYGSRAYIGLQLLHHLGPLATTDWMNHVAVSKSAVKFDREVVAPLTFWKLIDINEAGLFAIAHAGLDFLGYQVKELVEQESAPARYVHPMQPLSARHRVVRPIRSGAFDYRSHPSRIGDQLIEHGAKAVA